jgi:hypothetical protein
VRNLIEEINMPTGYEWAHSGLKPISQEIARQAILPDMQYLRTVAA